MGLLLYKLLLIIIKNFKTRHDHEKQLFLGGGGWFFFVFPFTPKNSSPPLCSDDLDSSRSHGEAIPSISTFDNF